MSLYKCGETCSHLSLYLFSSRAQVMLVGVQQEIRLWNRKWSAGTKTARLRDGGEVIFFLFHWFPLIKTSNCQTCPGREGTALRLSTVAISGCYVGSQPAIPIGSQQQWGAKSAVPIHCCGETFIEASAHRVSQINYFCRSRGKADVFLQSLRVSQDPPSERKTPLSVTYEADAAWNIPFWPLESFCFV